MADDRPEFFEVLGLAPPITADDVKQAYLEKAKKIHPDHGGDAAAFHQLQEAMDQAMQYASFRADRMKWLGVQAERYSAQESLIEHIESLGGKVTVEAIPWMKRSFGEDFAQLMDRVTGVTLRGTHVDDTTIEYLVCEQRVLQTIHVLDLAESRISDHGALLLRAFQELRRVDLSGTQVTNESLHLADWLPELRWLGVGGTRVSTVGKLKMKFRHPKLALG